MWPLLRNHESKLWELTCIIFFHNVFLPCKSKNSGDCHIQSYLLSYYFILKIIYLLYWSYKKGGFPGGSDGKESTCIAGDLSSIPGLGRSPGEGHGNPFQYSCLENSMDRRPGRLQSMESQRGVHNWAANTKILKQNFQLCTLTKSSCK